MLRLTSACLLVSTALCVATPATAQRIDDRRGIWFAVGFGAMSTEMNCTFCSEDRKLGPSGYAQIGGTPSVKTLAGLEFSYWRATDPDTTREYAAATASLLYFLSPEKSLFLKAGLGVGRYAEVSGPDQLSTNGFLIQVGLGYDFRLTPHLWTAPYFNYFWAPDHKGTRNRIGITSEFSLNMFQAGIKLSWH
jgi:hypothetical protein